LRPGRLIGITTLSVPYQMAIAFNLVTILYSRMITYRAVTFPDILD
jgi:hypothetical protein